MQFDDRAYQPRQQVPIVRKRWKDLLPFDQWQDIQRQDMGTEWSSHLWRISYPSNMKMNKDYFLQNGDSPYYADYQHQEIQVRVNQWWRFRYRLYQPDQVRWISMAMTYKYKRPRIIIYICFHNKLSFYQAWLFARNHGPGQMHLIRLRAIYGGPIQALNYQTDPKGTKLIKWWSRGILSRGQTPLH